MPPGTQDAERLDSRFTDEDADAAKGSLLDSDDDEEEIHACLHTGIEPLGVLTISTHGRGDLLPGSVKVTSDRPIGGFLRFSLPDIGVAGVGVSHPVRDALFPARRQAGGISTAAAIHNLGAEAMVATCQLMQAGAVLEETEIPLAANGQESQYIEEMSPSPVPMCRTSWGRCAARCRPRRGCSPEWPWRSMKATGSSPRCRWCRWREQMILRNR